LLQQIEWQYCSYYLSQGFMEYATEITPHGLM
jgi:hypothetical protein